MNAPIASVNPATGRTLKTFEPLDDAALAAKIHRSADAFARWRTVPIADRAARMLRAAEILDSEKRRFGELMTLEMGKTLRSAQEEAVKCAWVCRYYAENAGKFLADEPAPSGAARSYIRYEPIGPVLAVMPWNFPFWQVFRFAAPALMAGNTALLKHASNVPRCALAIEEIFLQAGFPEGVFQTLLIGAEAAGRVLDDPMVRAATLTGSEPAGRSVASRAGASLKKTVLELGGSDAFIVMPSADLDEAAAAAVKARAINNGQSCIAAKRFIVDASVADTFCKKFADGIGRLVTGDPMVDATDVGPLATPAILAALHDQVARSVKAGARLVAGGRKLPGEGNFYTPTLLADVPLDAPAWREETFGPVAAMVRARGVEEAVRMANDSAYGLGSAIWTRDKREADYAIANIEAGSVFVNGIVASDPRLPFGGVKNSGYGRELSVFGLREFVNIKTVWIGKESSV